MQKNVLPDTPWHVGFAKKKEDDPRRHKARCRYYEEGKCMRYNMKCCGSAHCKEYKERELDKLKDTDYGEKHYNKIWSSDKVKKFVADSTREEKYKFLKDIHTCPICGKELEQYNPLRRMVKVCNKCKVLYVDSAVYVTYTEEINKNISNYLLCLVGNKPPRNRGK